jgi:hypothetical protein
MEELIDGMSRAIDPCHLRGEMDSVASKDAILRHCIAPNSAREDN